VGLIDIESLLQDVTPDAPCGENLEYDPDYGELERATEGKPEQQFGDKIVPAEEPDWQDVERRALALLGRTKDLRVVLPLVWALVRNHGWVGCRDGLEVLKGLLERHWEHLHPELDVEDDNDPTLRVNTIAGLNDPDRMIAGLRLAPLVQSRAFGRFCLRDIQIVSGELSQPEDGELPNAQTIEAAFMDADLDELTGTANAVDESIRLLAGIESILMDRVGSTQAPDVESFSSILKAARQALADSLSRRTDAGAGGDIDQAENQALVEGSASPDAPAAAAAIGAIRSREDVVRVLDSICDYYQRNEPSSPVPILLRRAQRLVTKDFLALVQDLAPDGMSQLEVIRGPQGDGS
jgi:type VI secretion system protein ImpA